MYFKESDRIANEERFPKSAIEKIDRFLAQKQSSRVKLQDVKEFADVHENVAAILDKYVKFRVLKPYKMYFCPEHEDEVLVFGRISAFSKKGVCQHCNKPYSISSLEPETIYERKRKPREWSDSEPADAKTEPETPWWKNPRWIVEKIALPFALPLLLIFATLFFRHVFSSQESSQTISETLSVPTTTIEASPTFTSASSFTKTITATVASSVTSDITPPPFP